MVHSLRARFLLIVGIACSALILGGALFMQNLSDIGIQGAENLVLSRKAHLFHQVNHAAHMILEQHESSNSLQRLGESIEHEDDLFPLLETDERNIVEIVLKSLKNPDQPNPELLKVIQFLRNSHEKYDHALRKRHQEFEAGISQLHRDLLITAIIVAFLSAGPAFFLISDVRNGLIQLKRKLDLVNHDQDPSGIKVTRFDELGTIAKAFDEMYHIVKNRHFEETIANRFNIEQQRMAEFANLAGGIAHEVSNPLVSLMAQIDDLEAKWQEIAGTEQAQAIETDIETLRDGLARIESLVRKITAFSAYETDAGTENQCCDLNQVVQNIVEMAELHDRNRMVKFHQRLDYNLDMFDADPTGVAFGLFMVLSGSIKQLNNDKTHVTVATESGEGGVFANVSIEVRSPALNDVKRKSERAMGKPDFSDLGVVWAIVRGIGGELSLSWLDEITLRYVITFLKPDNDQNFHEGQA